jgi:large subunit ribosomal protein L35
MPKLKTKSGAKKRFRMTATGRIRMNQAGKRHGMRKRPQKMIRNARGSTLMCDVDARIIKRNFLPYAR